MTAIRDIREVYEQNKQLYKDEIINNINCVVAKRVDNIFYEKVEFVIFTTVGKVLDTITKEIIDEFSNSCFTKALSNYDGRGLFNNSGVVSISVLIGNDISKAAKQFTERPSKRHWGARQIHMIYDLKNDRFYNYSGWQIRGALLNPYYRRLMTETKNLIKATMKPSTCSRLNK